MYERGINMSHVCLEESINQVNWNFIDSNSTYLTHSIHSYPGKFIPQIPRNLIEIFSKEGDTVCDIFSGSGTTLVEAMLLNRNALGIDASPLACLISRAKTTCITVGEYESLLELVDYTKTFSQQIMQGSLFNTGPFKSRASRPDHKGIDFWFEPFIVEELAEILSLCKQLTSDSARTIALTAFSSIVVSVSKQDSDTRYVRKVKPNITQGSAFRRFGQVLKKNVEACWVFSNTVSTTPKIQVIEANILDHPEVAPFDLLVCSPPYPNAYSYHLYHASRMLWLGMDQPKFKGEEIGSHRKYSSKGPNKATVETFKIEMENIFEWIFKYLRDGGRACIVVGNSTLSGETINNADIIADAARQHGFIEEYRITRDLQLNRKAFNPVIGKIKTENIVILRKNGGLSDCKIEG